MKDLFAWKEIADTDVAECLKEAGFSKFIINMGNGNRYTMNCKYARNIYKGKLTSFQKMETCNFDLAQTKRGIEMYMD